MLDITTLEQSFLDYASRNELTWTADEYNTARLAYLEGYRAAKEAILDILEEERYSLWVAGAYEGSDYMNIALKLAEFSGKRKLPVRDPKNAV